MGRMPSAIWDPLAANFADQPRMRAHDIVCIHTMVGSLEGTDSLFRHTNGAGYAGTESHYGTGYDGRIEQWQDTAFIAEANYNGSWHIISVENADYGTGFPKWNTNDGSQVPAFTAAQIEANAKILAWETSPAAHAACPSTWTCHKVGIPLELIPDAKPGRRGIGYHRQGVPGYMVAGAEQWSTARGKVCPGDRRIAQIPQIIARAKQIRGGALTQEDDMPASDVFAWPLVELSDGRKISYGEVVKSMDRNIGALIQQVSGLNAAVTTLAGAIASGRDDLTAEELTGAVDEGIRRGGAAVQAAARAGAQEALAQGVDVDITVGGQGES